MAKAQRMMTIQGIRTCVQAHVIVRVKCGRFHRLHDYPGHAHLCASAHHSVCEMWPVPLVT